jgi:hypothetical protein
MQECDEDVLWFTRLYYHKWRPDSIGSFLKDTPSILDAPVKSKDSGMYYDNRIDNPVTYEGEIFMS